MSRRKDRLLVPRNTGQPLSAAAQELHKFRLSQGWTQAELCQALTAFTERIPSVMTVSKWETGKAKPGRPNALALNRLCKIELTGWDSYPTKHSEAGAL